MRAITTKAIWRICAHLVWLLMLLWPQFAFSEKWTVVENGKSLTFAVRTEVPNGDEMVLLEGRFPDWTAAIDIDFDDLNGSSIEIDVDPMSVELGRASLKTDLVGQQWFNAKRHPTAVFKSDSVVARADGYEAQGTLELNGVEAPLALPFRLTPSGALVQVEGRGNLDRFSWKIGDMTPASVVQSQVAIRFDFSARN